MSSGTENPYQSPSDSTLELSDSPIGLTKRQIKYLQNVLAFCERPPTFLLLLGKTWPALLFNLVMLGICYWIASSVPRDDSFITFMWFSTGMFAGLLLRYIGLLRSSARGWPLLAQIFDKQKIERMLGMRD